MGVSIDFSKILDDLKNNIAQLAKLTVSNYVTDAKKDAELLLKEMKADLERWTIQLADGKITTKEFEFLVNSEKDSVKMEALKQAGLAVIRVEQFKSSLFNLIVDTIFNKILP